MNDETWRCKHGCIVALGRLAAAVHGLGLLSEGQLSNLLGMDRMVIRGLVDDGRDSLATRNPSGLWGHQLVRNLDLES